ncbi:MAG TPA: hypothetical protein VIN56_01700 [Candidatus Dormibacteraeota bacterium]|jgi:hypothetical protein
MTSGTGRTAGRKPAPPRATTSAPLKPRPRRPEPEGFEPADLNPGPPPTRPGLPGAPAILTDLLRGPLQMVGQLTGIDTAARAMERLARSAERAAAILDRVSADRVDHLAASAERAAELLDRLDAEVGIDRVISVIERLERLSETADQMNRSLRAIEKLALDVQKKVIEPLDRLPIPRALREGLGGGSRKKPGR